MAGLADVRVEESLRIKIGEYVRKCSNVHLCFISVVQLLTRPSIPSIQNLLLFQHKQKNCRPNIRIMCGPKTEQQQKGKERKIKREEEGDESKKKKGNNITQRKQQSCEKKRKKKNRGWACSLSLSLTFYWYLFEYYVILFSSTKIDFGSVYLFMGFLTPLSFKQINCCSSV